MSCVPRAELLAMLLLSFSGFLAMAAEPAGTGDALPRPQYGAWGFDLTAADLASRPGDDFFRYGNGRWLDRVEIPADKPAYGMWAGIIDLTSQRLRGMLEKADANAGVAPVTIEEKVGAFYHSFMDEGRIEELAATPLNVLLDAVRQAGTHASGPAAEEFPAQKTERSDHAEVQRQKRSDLMLPRQNLEESSDCAHRARVHAEAVQ